MTLFCCTRIIIVWCNLEHIHAYTAEKKNLTEELLLKKKQTGTQEQTKSFPFLQRLYLNKILPLKW